MEKTEKKEITIADMWHIFVKNIKLLIIVTLVAAIIGGTLGGTFAWCGYTYGARLEFKISSIDSTDSLLYNLNSESFAEKLLLEANGLPPREICNAEDYDAALAAIEVYNQARETKREIKRELDRYQTSSISFEMDVLDSEYNKIFEQLKVYKTTYSDVIASEETHINTMRELEEQFNEISAKRQAYREETYLPAMQVKTELQEKYSRASLDLTDARREARELTEKVLDAWREDDEVQRQVLDISKSVKYAYGQLEEEDKDKTATVETEEQKNSRYVVATVAVEGDQELANFIVSRLKSRAKPYMVEHIEEITSSVQVDCTLISSLGSNNLENSSIVTQAVKYAVIVGAIAFVLLYIIVALKAYIKSESDSKSLTETSGGSDRGDDAEHDSAEKKEN